MQGASKAACLTVLVGLAACSGERIRPPSNVPDGGQLTDGGVNNDSGVANDGGDTEMDAGFEDGGLIVSPNDRTNEQGVVINVRDEVQGYLRGNLIDDDPTTSWRDDSNTTYIEIDFGATNAGAYEIVEFTMTSAADTPDGDPAWWTLIARSSTGEWDTLHQGGANFSARGERQRFTIDNPGSYVIYRFDMGNHAGTFTHLGEIELLAGGPAVCGDGSIGGNEICDGDSRTCSVGGYPGTEVCNLGCSGWENCTTTLRCGDGICSPGPENNGNCAQDCPVGTYPPPPVYSGTCPAMTEGRHDNFASLGEQRSFEVRLPPDPIGAPVVFAWHALNASPQDAMNWPGLDQIYSNEGFIIIAPYSCCATEWVIGGNPAQNPDLALFDDVLACLVDEYSVDVDRIYTTGFSAGGLYASYMLQVRSGHLAAAAPFSGGLLGSYVQPDFDIPVMFTWGGPGDLYGSFSFETATLNLSNAMQSDGLFVAHCVGNWGHSQPNDGGALAWRFFQDHPRGVAPEPYQGGLPGAFPNYCTIP
jgi:hypothetical protein